MGAHMEVKLPEKLRDDLRKFLYDRPWLETEAAWKALQELEPKASIEEVKQPLCGER